MSKSAGSPKKKKQFVKKPQYEGGAKALQNFVVEHIRYPEEAIKAKMEGDVHVKYDVNEEGVVTGAKVLRGIGFGCDEEALRIVRMLRFTPARNRGLHVTSHFDITIHFRLPNTIDMPTAPASGGSHLLTTSTLLNYTYTTQTPETISISPIHNTQSNNEHKSQLNTYNYTLTVNVPTSTSAPVSDNNTSQVLYKETPKKSVRKTRKKS